MLPLLVTLALASAPGLRAPTAQLPGPTIMPVFESVERIPLLPALRGAAARRRVTTPATAPARSVTIKVDPLEKRIELRSKEAPALAAHLRAAAAVICPTVEANTAVVVLRCRTQRLDAELTEERGQLYLDVRELRGLPFRGPEQEFPVFYDPLRLGSPRAPCPGSNPSARGECALHEGRRNEALIQFRLAADNEQSAHAAVRLADMALASGDVPAALDWYMRAGSVGPFGRLALARMCELTGGCLSKPNTNAFDWVGIANPVRGELMLRGARVELYAGRVAGAIRRISEAMMTSTPDQSFCDEIGRLFCRRLILGVLTRAERENNLPALETYLSLPDRTAGPLALELAEAAAERAAAAGAPTFGGNLMTAVFLEVPPAHLRDYLLRTAELYGLGGDWARARLVFDYAETRFPPRALADARWSAVRANLRSTDQTPDALTGAEKIRLESLATSVAQDVASAFGIVARARVANQQ